jgi:hypothetical protein
MPLKSARWRSGQMSLPSVETEGQMLLRAVAMELAPKNVVTINDKAHHSHLHKVVDEEEGDGDDKEEKRNDSAARRSINCKLDLPSHGNDALPDR